MQNTLSFWANYSDVHASIFKRIIFVGLLFTGLEVDANFWYLLKIKTTIVNYIDRMSQSEVTIYSTMTLHYTSPEILSL